MAIIVFELREREIENWIHISIIIFDLFFFYFCFGHFINDFVVFENANVKVFGADDELVEAVAVKVEQRQRTNIISRYLFFYKYSIKKQKILNDDFLLVHDFYNWIHLKKIQKIQKMDFMDLLISIFGSIWKRSNIWNDPKREIYYGSKSKKKKSMDQKRESEMYNLIYGPQ